MVVWPDRQKKQIGQPHDNPGVQKNEEEKRMRLHTQQEVGDEILTTGSN